MRADMWVAVAGRAQIIRSAVSVGRSIEESLQTWTMAIIARERVLLLATFSADADAERRRLGANRRAASERSRRDASSDTSRSTHVLSVRRRRTPRRRKKKRIEESVQTCTMAMRFVAACSADGSSCPSRGPRMMTSIRTPAERSFRYIGSISASPTACPLCGYGRASTQNDSLSERRSF